jgi:hypothetical protein
MQQASQQPVKPPSRGETCFDCLAEIGVDEAIS